MSRFSDLLGTLRTRFRIGLTGVTIGSSSGSLIVRNTADSADAPITASNANISGDSVTLNSDGASGADRAYTLSRPTTGMSADQTFTFPAGNGTAGQVLQTDGSGNTSWVSAGSTASSLKVDTTTLAFGSTSPVAMFSTGGSDVIFRVAVIVDTSFNGTPSLSIGISGTTSKYMASTDIDLTAAAGTEFEVHPGLPAAGVEALIATYSAGGASAGSARILVYFATPQ